MLCGGEVSRKVKRHLKLWASKGCPCWNGFSEEHLVWWTEWKDILFRNNRNMPYMIWEYYAGVAALGLDGIRKANDDSIREDSEGSTGELRVQEDATVQEG